MAHTDFNGDGYDDLLWRRDDGLTTIWNGTAQSLRQSTTFSQLVATDWTIAGTGDFNGDGKDDILWRKADGQLTVWSGNGAAFDSTFNQMVATDWSVEAVGDFNGDGRDDIFWRRGDGLVTTWVANAQGGFDDPHAPLGQVGMEWAVQDTGDVNGDGFEDVLWKKTDLELTVWTSNGTTPVQNDAWNQYPTDGPAPLHAEWVLAAGLFVSGASDSIMLLNWNPSQSASGVFAAGIQTANGADFQNVPGLAEGFNGLPPQIISGDYNGDGTDDVAILSAGSFLRVLPVDPTPDPGIGWEYGSLYAGAVTEGWHLIL